MTAVNSWCWPILSVLSYSNRKVPCVRPSGGLRQFIGTTCGSHFYLFLLNKSSQHVVGMIITCPLMSLILNHIQSSMTSLESNSHRIRLSWDFSFYSHTSASRQCRGSESWNYFCQSHPIYHGIIWRNFLLLCNCYSYKSTNKAIMYICTYISFSFLQDILISYQYLLPVLWS